MIAHLTINPKGEQVVVVHFDRPHIYGNNIPFSDAKRAASDLLRKPYGTMRVIDLKFDTEQEGVVEYTIAHRPRRR